MIRIPTNRPPTHPGEMLVEEFLNPMQITQRELATAIHVPYQRVNELINQKRGITPSTAFALPDSLEYPQTSGSIYKCDVIFTKIKTVKEPSWMRYKVSITNKKDLTKNQKTICDIHKALQFGMPEPNPVNRAIKSDISWLSGIVIVVATTTTQMAGK